MLSAVGYCPGPKGLIHNFMLPGLRTPFKTPASSMRPSFSKRHLSQPPFLKTTLYTVTIVTIITRIT